MKLREETTNISEKQPTEQSILVVPELEKVVLSSHSDEYLQTRQRVQVRYGTHVSIGRTVLVDLEVLQWCYSGVTVQVLQWCQNNGCYSRCKLLQLL